jgi:hypothetical protein
MATYLPADVLELFLTPIMVPLHKTLSSSTEANDKIGELASQIEQLLKRKLGVTKYTAAYAKQHEYLTSKKAMNKTHKSQLAVQDPELYAAQKTESTRRRNLAKKRKRTIADDKISIRTNRITAKKPVDDQSNHREYSSKRFRRE